MHSLTPSIMPLVPGYPLRSIPQVPRQRFSNTPVATAMITDLNSPSHVASGPGLSDLFKRNSLIGWSTLFTRKYTNIPWHGFWEDDHAPRFGSGRIKPSLTRIKRLNTGRRFRISLEKHLKVTRTLCHGRGMTWVYSKQREKVGGVYVWLCVL